MNDFVPGIEGFHKITVTEAMLATAYGSGAIGVFATPAMIALMEKTAMDSVASFLPDDHTTVGTEVHVSHIKATKPGKPVSFKSVLTHIEGRQLLFSVEAYENDTLIGSGTHTRFIVDIERFLTKI